MSDLSVFKLDTQTINIKDTTAREAAESAKTLATTASGNATTALNKINELESEKADAIISSTSGAIASFPDGAESTAKELVVAIEPVQEGTGDPSPDNVRPITGWTGAKVTRTGKNLIDMSDITDYSKWSADIASSGDMPSSSGNRIYSLPALKSGVQYTISFGVTSASFPTYLYFGYYKDNSTKKIAYVTTDYINNQSISFTAIAGVTYCLRMGDMFKKDTFKAQIAKLSYIQLELGSTATDYEPYAGQTYSITFPSEAGTVYGGTLDVTNGVLTVDRAMVDLGTLTWSGNQRFTAIVQDSLKPVGNGAIPNWVCSALKIATPNGVYGNTVDYAVSYYGSSLIQARINDITDAVTFKTAMSGVQLVYELATPITYQLTPQEITSLLGTNNLWADTGDMSVTYRADTKLYIDKKFTELQALILEN